MANDIKYKIITIDEHLTNTDWGSAALKDYLEKKALLPVKTADKISYFVILADSLGKFRTKFGAFGTNDVRTLGDTRKAKDLDAAKLAATEALEKMASPKAPEAPKGRSMRIVTVAKSTFEEHETRLGEFALTGKINKFGGDNLATFYIVPVDFMTELYTEIGSLGVNTIHLPGSFKDFSDAVRAAEKQLKEKPISAQVVKDPGYRIVYIPNDVVNHVGKSKITEIHSVYEVTHDEDIVGGAATYFVAHARDIENIRDVVGKVMPGQDVVHFIEIMDSKSRYELDKARQAAEDQLSREPKPARPPAPQPAAPARPAQAAGRSRNPNLQNPTVTGGPPHRGRMSGPGANPPIAPNP